MLNNRFENKTNQLLNEFLIAAPVVVPAAAAAAPAISSIITGLLAPLITIGGALAIHHGITSKQSVPTVQPQASPDSAPSKQKMLPGTLSPTAEPDKKTVVPTPLSPYLIYLLLKQKSLHRQLSHHLHKLQSMQQQQAVK